MASIVFLREETLKNCQTNCVVLSWFSHVIMQQRCISAGDSNLPKRGHHAEDLPMVEKAVWGWEAGPSLYQYHMRTTSPPTLSYHRYAPSIPFLHVPHPSLQFPTPHYLSWKSFKGIPYLPHAGVHSFFGGSIVLFAVVMLSSTGFCNSDEKSLFLWKLYPHVFSLLWLHEICCLVLHASWMGTFNKTNVIVYRN